MRLTLAALALAAVPAGAADTSLLAGRVAGAPADCIDPSGTTGPTIMDATTILYRQSGRRVWRTAPDGACPSLGPQKTLIVELWGGRLCRGDRFRVLEPGTTIPSAYCRFAAFVPYDRPARTR